MSIIDNAVSRVVADQNLRDPNSREFMLAAFKEAHYSLEDFDPWRTAEDVISDGMMRYSSAYTDIIESLMRRIQEEKDDV